MKELLNIVNDSPVNCGQLELMIKVKSFQEQLIICYLTINRTVGFVRVLHQPIGGLYPVIIAPPNGIEQNHFIDDKIKNILKDSFTYDH